MVGGGLHTGLLLLYSIVGETASEGSQSKAQVITLTFHTKYISSCLKYLYNESKHLSCLAWVLPSRVHCQYKFCSMFLLYFFNVHVSRILSIEMLMSRVCPTIRMKTYLIGNTFPFFNFCQHFSFYQKPSSEEHEERRRCTIYQENIMMTGF